MQQSAALRRETRRLLLQSGVITVSYIEEDMKKEIGKWFMDIAKYIATAVLLTQIFGGLADSPFIIVYALLSVIAIFSVGVSILHGSDLDEKRAEKNRNKNAKGKRV